MNLKVIEEELKKHCEEKGWILFECKYQPKDSTLSILLDNKFDLDELEKVSEDLSSFMDHYENDIDENYVLDVSTVGIERPIRNEEEVVKAIGEYIYCKSKDDEVTGTLKKFDNNILSIEYKDKTSTKIKNIEYSKVKKVRYAVKF